ncbi:adhesin [Ornithinibacillus gellani]|uniref:metal ABC transporter solute-binding protein, Zn/Mn family n=1 Tax=Ornithinibacillus gellani TaxID=2293253 RepID=UPI000F46C7D3|nr:zinc ABC transporter substrate-binding protein [Ornithinibacillus gellani]TQS74731.1 adhesin [Ornithinibacillus gellani]
MFKHITYLVGLLFLVLLTACTDSSSHSSDANDKLTIYTTIYPIQFAVEQIGGNNVDASSIYPPGVDAHTYEPTTKEMTHIAKADAFMYLGAGMEGFAETAEQALQNQTVTFVEIGALQQDLFKSNQNQHHDAQEDGHEHSDVDPHIWLDPIRMAEMSEVIKDELIALDPDHKEIFEKNYDSLKEKLFALDKDLSDTISSKSKHHILVAHAAYGYWEARYGIEQLAISGLSTSSEPSQKELAAIVDLAKQYQIHYVIFEQTGKDKIATIIQEHINAKPLEIHNLESLTESDIQNGSDYLFLMKENINTLNIALDDETE